MSHLLSEHDSRVLKQAVHTLALAAYAKFQPEEAPPLELVKSYSSLASLMGRQDSKAEDSDRHHRDLFRRYEWEAMDEFDAVLLDGVDRGLFDEVAIKRQADELQKKLQLTDKNNSFEQACESLQWFVQYRSGHCAQRADQVG